MAETKFTPGQWKPTLAEELAERAKRQMLDTEREAFQAAQSGDKARQSIASTESERHRAVYHAMCLIIADQRNEIRTIPVDLMGGKANANAHLIAAAPDLYEASELFDELATQQAVDSPEWRDSDSVRVVVTIGTLRAIKAARAKARGETHPSGGDRHGE